MRSDEKPQEPVKECNFNKTEANETVTGAEYWTECIDSLIHERMAQIPCSSDMAEQLYDEIKQQISIETAVSHNINNSFTRKEYRSPTGRKQHATRDLERKRWTRPNEDNSTEQPHTSTITHNEPHMQHACHTIENEHQTQKCCDCNGRNAVCKNCKCVKSNFPCLNCYPSRRGRCTNLPRNSSDEPKASTNNGGGNNSTNGVNHETRNVFDLLDIITKNRRPVLKNIPKGARVKCLTAFNNIFVKSFLTQTIKKRGQNTSFSPFSASGNQPEEPKPLCPISFQKMSRISLRKKTLVKRIPPPINCGKRKTVQIPPLKSWCVRRSMLGTSKVL
jgi:hypothetical protein